MMLPTYHPGNSEASRVLNLPPTYQQRLKHRDVGSICWLLCEGKALYSLCELPEGLLQAGTQGVCTAGCLAPAHQEALIIPLQQYREHLQVIDTIIFSLADLSHMQ
jgi:hypothetical protein